MNLQTTYGRVLCLHAAAKRLRIPERTLRYQASRGWIQGAYKQGKLWKFPLPAIEKFQPRRMAAIALIAVAICLVSPMQAADLHLEKYRGKVVLLNFWATWCHGCKLEIPWFMEYQKKYKHSGFTVVGVAMARRAGSWSDRTSRRRRSTTRSWSATIPSPGNTASRRCR